MNKKDTIGRKCHRRNAQEIICFPQRFLADRETLSRVLQSALIAGQGTHTVQEASHGHSSCARSEDPVWTWSWWTGLARASERKRAGGGEGKLCRFHSRRKFAFAEICSLRCFAIVIISCVHDLRSRESLQNIPFHSMCFVRGYGIVSALQREKNKHSTSSTKQNLTHWKLAASRGNLTLW